MLIALLILICLKIEYGTIAFVLEFVHIADSLLVEHMVSNVQTFQLLFNLTTFRLCNLKIRFWYRGLVSKALSLEAFNLSQYKVRYFSYPLPFFFT